MLVRLLRWRAERNASIEDARFPYGEFRPGQRSLAVSCFRAFAAQRNLVLQAPTGIGKTAGVLFPAIKSLPAGRDKVFFLTAKTIGRQVAESTLDDMRGAGLRLRSVSLTAKDKICFTPGAPCDPDACVYARGYYDKLPSAIEDLRASDGMSRQVIEMVARTHEVCPFELSLDASRWADVIICDYNYVFDPTVYLRRFFDDVDGEYLFLIDEAHNLVDRGRDMYSAEIAKSDVLALRRALGPALPEVWRKLTGINRGFLTLMKEADSEGVVVLASAPGDFIRQLRAFCQAAEDWSQLNESAEFEDPLKRLYFDALRFMRRAEDLDHNFVVLLRCHPGRKARLKLFCINPGPMLNTSMKRSVSSVVFSATMTPERYFATMLGLDDTCDWYRIASPFPAGNMGTFIAGHIDTSFRGREASGAQLVDLLVDIVNAQTGNYMVFFPCYRYMQTIAEAFARRAGDVRTRMQAAAMSESEHESFLEAFVHDPEKTLVGFALMGGIFGEGIDLKGTRLIGALIVGVGLPQVGIERDLIRHHFAETGLGFGYAYQYPGMSRVMQTAGRVIRSAVDRGIVCLIDQRFTASRYRDLMPIE
jgi:Rad3-related DNA helicase